MEKVHFKQLGLIDYKDAWEIQEKKFDQLVERKLQNRSLPEAQRKNQEHHLFFCQHSPVFTLGKNAKKENLLADEQFLAEKGIQIYQINRGGDITHHGPEQLVGYPVLDLEFFMTDIDKYLRLLEEMIILTLAEYGIKGERMPGATGVWIEPDNIFHARKICAMGIRCSRWVTMHGWALNVNNDLKYFDFIIPCGLKGKQVTSMQKELGHPVNMQELEQKLKKHFATLFNVDLVESVQQTTLR